MTREQARADINSRPLTDFVSLEPNPRSGKNHYNCPICGSGTGTKGTAAFTLFPDTKRVICFSNACFGEKGEDTLGALRLIWKCNETEAIKRAGYQIDGAQMEEGGKAAQNAPSINRKPPEQKDEEPDYSSFYRQCHDDLKRSREALDYLHGRGITDESIDRFNLGYCAAWISPKSQNARPSKRIILPRTKEGYTARAIEELGGGEKMTTKQKCFFNGEALNADVVFVCEGELDTISLLQAGAEAVLGMGADSNKNFFLEEARKHPDTVFILALDNDPVKDNGKSPGRDTQKELAEKMKAEGLRFIDYDPQKIYKDYKDANEFLVADKERLGRIVSFLQAEGRQLKALKDAERAEDLRKRTGEGMVEAFLQTVTGRRDFEPIPTGIRDLDKALLGGFIRKTLVMLGAAPAMGKTALSQWIFENIARAGFDVLYINLEMAREQLLARSISRIAWKTDGADISPIDILRGYTWTMETRETIYKAANLYKREIAPHFIYNPDGVTNRIDSILQAMTDETNRLQAMGLPAPIVCIDYLQLIDSGERDAIEGMKATILKLKTFAVEHNTVVYLIMANNRASNKEGTADVNSGRDTSAIEYSADILLGLVYTAIEDREKYKSVDDSTGRERYFVYDLAAIHREKREAYQNGRPAPMICNRLSLKVNKNRFGDSERRANLIFDGRHSTFCEEEKYRS